MTRRREPEQPPDVTGDPVWLQQECLDMPDRIHVWGLEALAAE